VNNRARRFVDNVLGRGDSGGNDSNNKPDRNGDQTIDVKSMDANTYAAHKRSILGQMRRTGFNNRQKRGRFSAGA